MATQRGMIICLVGFVAVLLVYLMTQTPGAPKGKEVPDFALPLAAPAKPTRMSELRGKVVILDFWATWCEPCQVSMPRLEQIYQKYKAKGLVVIGVAEDAPETKAQIPATVKRLKVTYPIAAALDMDPKIANVFGHDGIPALFLIDQQGALIDKEEGFAPELMDKLDSQIGQMLPN
jgi:cytochrome c biogenesis protein CcmG/thiol:disulfide interchange protein DsbE